MKKLFWVLAIALPLGAMMISCEKESLLTDEALIEEIAFSSSRTNVAPEVLPTEITEQITEANFDTYVETAFYLRDRGYEVNLGNGENLFFNTEGRLLEFRGTVRPNGPFGPNGPHGPCHRPGFGRPVRIDALLPAITEYIATNYPDGVILRAMTRGGNFFVLVSGRIVLSFDSEGNFLGEHSPFIHCARPCREVLAADELPDAITMYLATNFPDATFRYGCDRDSRIHILLLTADGRVLLVFSEDGTLLFQRG